MNIFCSDFYPKTPSPIATLKLEEDTWCQSSTPAVIRYSIFNSKVFKSFQLTLTDEQFSIDLWVGSKESECSTRLNQKAINILLTLQHTQYDSNVSAFPDKSDHSKNHFKLEESFEQLRYGKVKSYWNKARKLIQSVLEKEAINDRLILKVIEKSYYSHEIIKNITVKRFSEDSPSCQDSFLVSDRRSIQTYKISSKTLNFLEQCQQYTMISRPSHCGKSYLFNKIKNSIEQQNAKNGSQPFTPVLSISFLSCSNESHLHSKLESAINSFFCQLKDFKVTTLEDQKKYSEIDETNYTTQLEFLFTLLQKKQLQCLVIIDEFDFPFYDAYRNSSDTYKKNIKAISELFFTFRSMQKAVKKVIMFGVLPIYDKDVFCDINVIYDSNIQPKATNVLKYTEKRKLSIDYTNLKLAAHFINNASADVKNTVTGLCNDLESKVSLTIRSQATLNFKETNPLSFWIMLASIGVFSVERNVNPQEKERLEFRISNPTIAKNLLQVIESESRYTGEWDFVGDMCKIIGTTACINLEIADQKPLKNSPEDQKALDHINELKDNFLDCDIQPIDLSKQVNAIKGELKNIGNHVWIPLLFKQLPKGTWPLILQFFTEEIINYSRPNLAEKNLWVNILAETLKQIVGNPFIERNGEFCDSQLNTIIKNINKIALKFCTLEELFKEVIEITKPRCFVSTIEYFAMACFPNEFNILKTHLSAALQKAEVNQKNYIESCIHEDLFKPESTKTFSISFLLHQLPNYSETFFFNYTLNLGCNRSMRNTPNLEEKYFRNMQTMFKNNGFPVAEWLKSEHLRVPRFTHCNWFEDTIGDKPSVNC
ncbi:MAG: AAA family ATPase [Chlamydiota bacterium]|nr:AAA family ATPase [Chlamydiota bacterium]